MKNKLMTFLIILIVSFNSLGQCSLNYISSNYPPSCTDSCTNWASININGTFPCTYQWNDINNSMTQSISNLCPGTYICTVTDFLGCTVIGSISFPDSINFSININSQEPTCPSCNDGSATAIVTGNNFPYSYLWDHFITTSWVNNLGCGVHVIDIWDQYGCHKSDTVILCSGTTIQNSEFNSNFKIFPLLVTDKLHIENYSEIPYLVSIISTNGKLVFSEMQYKKVATINFDNIECGTFVISINQGGKIINKKIIKE